MRIVFDLEIVSQAFLLIQIFKHQFISKNQEIDLSLYWVAFFVFLLVYRRVGVYQTRVLRLADFSSLGGNLSFYQMLD